MRVWGIDLTGRRMRHEPWPTGQNGAYRKPDLGEISSTYGISGASVVSWLELLPESAREGLCRRLRETLPASSGGVDLDFLLDPEKQYSNEFYFYVVQMAKLEAGDYSFRVLPGEGELLGVSHKIYERGFLRYEPFGDGVDDVTNAIPCTILGRFGDRLDKAEILSWLDCLSTAKCGKRYSEFAAIENFMICSEFTF